MGLFKSQLANVVEWEEYRDDVIFYKWNNSEIKKGSRLIIRPGQDAIFLYNGVTEGVFEKEGNYDIESDFIKNLIDQNKAQLVLIVQSKDNKFFNIKQGQRQIHIPKTRISFNKRTTVQLLIQAKEEVNFKENDDLNSFYST